MGNGFSIKRILGKKTATVLFCAVAVAWFVADRLSKLAAADYQVGQVFSPEILGIFQLKLAHNTGAAWSMFSNSTTALGVFSLLVCALLLGYLFVYRKAQANVLELIGLSLVFSGGVGNALDRFVYGYVIDFFDLTFMNFPVFNVADIGVTCGMVILLAGTMFYLNECEQQEKEGGACDA